MPLAIDPTDPRLRWRGAVSLQPGPGWVAPWRVPWERARLHLPAGGLGRAAMPAGVRICFATDAPWLDVAYEADPAPPLNGPQETARLDVVVDGERAQTLPLRADGGDATVRVDTLPGAGGGTPATVELWLPPYHQLRLRGLTVPDGAVLEPDERALPAWVHDGSSISQGRGAASPSGAWTARVAAAGGLDLTCLALGAACHMQPLTARLMRDRPPAALLSACVGINSQALTALNEETFLAAVIGYVETVRERHPETPFVLLSTTYAPWREDVPNPAGLTIRDTRRLAARAVELLRAHGDAHVHHLDGLELFGPDDAGRFLERDHPEAEPLHPDPDGHVLMAERLLTALERLSALPVTAAG